jgi:hypothetical protein
VRTQLNRVRNCSTAYETQTRISIPRKGIVMSQSSKPDAKARTLLEALIEDSIAASANEVREEISAAGSDPTLLAAQMRAKALELVMNSRKSRLVHAQDQLRRSGNRSASAIPRNAGQIRQKLRELVSGNESFVNGRVALAFRNGVTQSDNDVLTLWQDLIDLGAVTDNDLHD